METLLDELNRVFADDICWADNTGCLALIKERLFAWGATEVFVADANGEVLATHPPLEASASDLTREIARALAKAIENVDIAETSAFRCGEQAVDALGVRIPSIGERVGFLAIMRIQLNAEARQLSIRMDELMGLARVAWSVVEQATMLREAQARNRQLLAEQESLKRAHAEIVENVLEERESHLQEKRRHIVELEAEVTRRSAALKEAMRRAEAANSAKSEFLANMSHEIRTPMTAILGYSESLLDPDITEEERKGAIEILQRNGRHLLELINDILDLSKIESGKLATEILRCSPGQLAAEVYSLMRVRADAKNLSWTVEFPGPLPDVIETDATRLKQILINLVGNAIKFTKSGGVRLVVSLARPSEQDGGDGKRRLRFEVIDTGIGMTAGQLNGLFQPFMQADSSVTRNYGGTGLGLAISKRLARALGGDLSVSSAHGAGSTFTLSIDAGSLNEANFMEGARLEDFLAAKDRAQSFSQPQVDLSDALKGRRILLAEDGPDNQRLIAFILRKSGANVSLAENGEEAVKAVQEAASNGSPFDAILMDMQMPVMDGYNATRRLRELNHGELIIALTAHAMASDRDKCLSAGCDDYATKPIDRVTLIQLLQRRTSKAK